MLVERKNKRRNRYKYASVKSFVKDESYIDYKHARIINSRCDGFKTLVGPIFKLIETAVFKLKWFIKHVPIKERVTYIKDMIPTKYAHYVCTDHSQFESHFIRELMESCEFELYDYMTSNLACHDDFMFMVREFIGGEQYLALGEILVVIECLRLSGEMNTSLGNGFSNLMFMLFVCYIHEIESDGVVEGDDGLFGVTSIPPVEDFTRLGLTVKMDVVKTLSEASFCGMIFDIDDEQVIANPYKVILQLGWTTAMYLNAKPRLLKELLKGKLLCCLYQFPACPLITPLCHVLLSQLTDVTASYKFMTYTSITYLSSLFNMFNFLPVTKIPEIKYGTRYLMERLYGITVDHQLIIEKQFLDAKIDESISSSMFDQYIPKIYFHNYDKYVCQNGENMRFGVLEDNDLEDFNWKR